MNELPPSFETKQLQSYTEEQNKRFVTDDLVLHVVSATEDTARLLKQRTFFGRLFDHHKK